DYQPQDTLWFTGDLIARGPDSLKVLRFVHSLQDKARLVLGNHDLNLLAITAQLRQAKPKDNLTELLAADDLPLLIDWLTQQPLLQYEPQLQLVMIHAGISPQWTLKTALQSAKEVSQALNSPYKKQFLSQMFGDTPNDWQ